MNNACKYQNNCANSVIRKKFHILFDMFVFVNQKFIGYLCYYLTKWKKQPKVISVKNIFDDVKLSQILIITVPSEINMSSTRADYITPPV